MSSSSDTEPAAPDEPKTRGKPEETGAKAEEGLGRREVISKVGIGIVTASLAAPLVMSVRSLVPNALYELPRRFKAGAPQSFGEGATFLPAHRVFLIREKNTFCCISATCTHLGCTVQLARVGPGTTQSDIEFHCPCHGSKFRGDGTNYAGPAPRPLDYYELSLAPDDGQLVVDASTVADKGWRFSV